MARLPTPRRAHAESFKETTCICRRTQTSGRPQGGSNRFFSWTRVIQRGERWPSAWRPVSAGTNAAEHEPEHLRPAPTERAHELRQGWGVKTRTSTGRDNSRRRLLHSTHELAHPQTYIAVDHIAQHAMRCRDRQHTVVSEGVGTQARDRRRTRVAKGVYPSQTWEIVGGPG